MSSLSSSFFKRTRILWVPVIYIIQFAAIFQALVFVNSEIEGLDFLSRTLIQILALISAAITTYILQKRAIGEHSNISKEMVVEVLVELGITSSGSPKYLEQDKIKLLEKVLDNYKPDTTSIAEIDVDFELRLGEAARMADRPNAANSHFEVAVRASEEQNNIELNLRAKLAYSSFKLDLVLQDLETYQHYDDYKRDIHDIIIEISQLLPKANVAKASKVVIEAHQAIGFAFYLIDENQRSLGYLESAMDHAENFGDSTLILEIMVSQLDVYFDMEVWGDFNETLAKMRTILDSDDYPLHEGYYYGNLAYYQTKGGYHEEAERNLNLATDYFNKVGFNLAIRTFQKNTSFIRENVRSSDN